MIEKIIGEIKKSYPDNLIAVYLTGSCTSSDFIKGISDYDILIVLTQVSERDLFAVGEIGEKLKLTDEFNLVPKSLDELTKNTGLWRLIDKYQSKFLFGKDVFKELGDPIIKDLVKDNLSLLHKVSGRRDKWKYSTFKSDEVFKAGMYWILKRTMTLFNSVYFIEHREYLNSRENIGLKTNRLSKIINVLDNWSAITRKDISEVFDELDETLNYINKISKAHVKE